MVDRLRHAGRGPVAEEEEGQRARNLRLREEPPGERPQPEGEDDLPAGEEPQRRAVALLKLEGQSRTQAARRTRTGEARRRSCWQTYSARG